MNILKILIGLPLLVVMLVFAFVNNDFATFNLWPFYIEVTVSLSVAIIFLTAFGFIMGMVWSWMSYAPEMREQKKINKKLNRAHSKLVEKYEGLQENLETLKKEDPAVKPEKMSLNKKIREFFSRGRNKAYLE